MTLKFLTDYRNRAWMFRAQAGAVVTLENPALIAACLEAGVAEEVAIAKRAPARVAPPVAPVDVAQPILVRTRVSKEKA